MIKKLALFLTIVSIPFLASADCVYNAKGKTTFQVLSTGYGGKILFSGGYGADFIVSVDGYISSNLGEVIILKDDFCSWENNVLYIDEEVFDVRSVDKI